MRYPLPQMHSQPPPAPGRTRQVSTAQALCFPGPSGPSASAACGAPLWPRWLGNCCVLFPGPDFHGPARLARPRPPHRSAVRLARSPESVSSFIEMLPHRCPSSRFQSPEHPPRLFPAPSLTLETGLHVRGPRERGGLVPWWGEALQNHGGGQPSGEPGQAVLKKGSFLKSTG